jgi:hypothetical protein
MSLLDIFSTPFLLSAALAVLLVGIVFTYVNFKISEQDHKFSSMIGLISTMAQEVNFLRSKIANQGQCDLVNPSSSNKSVSLIEVSDDDDDENDELDIDDDEDSEEEDDDDDEDSEEEDDEEEDYDNDAKTVKILNITNSFADMLELHNSKSTGEMKHDAITIHHGDDDDDGSLSSHESLFLIEETNSTLENSSSLITQNADIFKTIQISPDEHDSIDFKKMPVEKLRKLVLEQKLVADPSKLKKHDLVKLLEEKDK